MILSDGDVVFQPRKVERSGIFEAVDGHVLIYIHKEESLEDVVRRYLAEHYVMVDDKLAFSLQSKNTGAIALRQFSQDKGSLLSIRKSSLPIRQRMSPSIALAVFLEWISPICSRAVNRRSLTGAV